MKFSPSLFHKASYKGDADVVKMLIESGTDINSLNRYGNSAIGLASYKGNTYIVRMLIEAGANINH
jgi:ankyrin repeat protein